MGRLKFHNMTGSNQRVGLNKLRLYQHSSIICNGPHLSFLCYLSNKFIIEPAEIIFKTDENFSDSNVLLGTILLHFHLITMVANSLIALIEPIASLCLRTIPN
jgi:hypothetical protein